MLNKNDKKPWWSNLPSETILTPHLAEFSRLTNLSIESASQIRSIEAEPLLRQDKDEKFHNTSDFQINLVVRDANIIGDVQDGLEIYFSKENEYIQNL